MNIFKKHYNLKLLLFNYYLKDIIAIIIMCIIIIFFSYN